MTYFWIKSFHVLFVMAWVAAVFYLPRILINIAEVGPQGAGRERLVLMGLKLYRFGHIMFGLAFLFGLALWQGWRFLPIPDVTAGSHWLHAKLGLVVLLLAAYIWTGRMVKSSARGGKLLSTKALRLGNELPVLLLLGIIFLVLAKPF